MAFKPAKKFTSSSNMIDDNRILKPDSGFTIIPGYLKDKNSTVIRMLPALDENGNEDITLNPEGSSDCIEEALGQAFVSLEICSFFKGGRHTFISSILPEDRNGNAAPGGDSPARKFMRRIRYKLWEQTTRKSKGHKLDVPEHWLAWYEKDIVNEPLVQYAIQCSAREINGEVRTDMKKKPVWVYPSIFLIPSSAFKTFGPKITERRDPTKPLSLQNNRFGDFCSVKGGHMLRLVKYQNPQSKSTKGGTVYDLLLDDPCPMELENVKSIVKPWDEILNIPTVEDVIEILMNTFEPMALDYAYRNTPYQKYLDPSIIGLAADMEEAVKPDQIRNMESARVAPRAPVKQQVVQTAPLTLNDDADDTQEEAEDNLQYGNDPAETPQEPVAEDQNKYQQQLQQLLAKSRVNRK
jgi:hypothetical protein